MKTTRLLRSNSRGLQYHLFAAKCRKNFTDATRNLDFHKMCVGLSDTHLVKIKADMSLIYVHTNHSKTATFNCTCTTVRSYPTH